MQTAEWGMTDFRDQVAKLLQNDKTSEELRLYSYAVTMSGWNILDAPVKRWMRRTPRRTVAAYVGTDHALTDPDALDAMHSAGIKVYLLRHYRGVFHPKVVWFVQPSGGILLAGSNNLTEDGLSNNIEFATMANLSRADPALEQWHQSIHSASDPYSVALVGSYRKEKERFGRERAKVGSAKTFTWSRRTSGGSSIRGYESVTESIDLKSGDLVLEVMPRETSAEGRQVQIPSAVANRFFRLGSAIGASERLSVVHERTSEERRLTMTRNRNHTTRLSIRELDYRSRPCVLRIRKLSATRFSVLVVRRSIDPEGYATLIGLCPQPSGRRRWRMVK